MKDNGKFNIFSVSAALFFCTYETVKNVASKVCKDKSSPLIHMTGASFGEVVCP